METNQKQFQTAVIFMLVIIIVGLLLTNCKVSDIENASYGWDSGGVDTDRYSEFENLQEQLDTLGRKLEKQNSRIDSCYVNCADYDLRTLRGNVAAKIRLKEYTDDTKVSLTIGNETADLKLDKGVFKGTINMDITRIYDALTVDINENGKHSSETISDIMESDEDMGDMDWNYFLVEEKNNACSINYEDDETIAIQPGKYILGLVDKEELKDYPVFYISDGTKNIFQQDMEYNEKEKYFELGFSKEKRIKNAKQYRIYAQFTLKTGEKFQYVYETYEDEDEEDTLLLNKDGRDIRFEYTY